MTPICLTCQELYTHQSLAAEYKALQLTQVFVLCRGNKEWMLGGMGEEHSSRQNVPQGHSLKWWNFVQNTKGMLYYIKSPDHLHNGINGTIDVRYVSAYTAIAMLSLSETCCNVSHGTVRVRYTKLETCCIKRDSFLRHRLVTRLKGWSQA